MYKSAAVGCSNGDLTAASGATTDTRAKKREGGDCAITVRSVEERRR
jgi:hypothetical protein